MKARLLKNCPRNSAAQSPAFAALSALDDFQFTPQVRTLSGTVPGTSWNNDLENREPTGDCSQINPHPEVEFSACWTRNSVNSDPDETSHRYKMFFFLFFKELAYLRRFSNRKTKIIRLLEASFLPFVGYLNTVKTKISRKSRRTQTEGVTSGKEKISTIELNIFLCN